MANFSINIGGYPVTILTKKITEIIPFSDDINVLKIKPGMNYTEGCFLMTFRNMSSLGLHSPGKQVTLTMQDGIGTPLTFTLFIDRVQIAHQSNEGTGLLYVYLCDWRKYNRNKIFNSTNNYAVTMPGARNTFYTNTASATYTTLLNDVLTALAPPSQSLSTSSLPASVPEDYFSLQGTCGNVLQNICSEIGYGIMPKTSTGGLIIQPYKSFDNSDFTNSNVQISSSGTGKLNKYLDSGGPSLVFDGSQEPYPLNSNVPASIDIVMPRSGQSQTNAIGNTKSDELNQNYTVNKTCIGSLTPNSGYKETVYDHYYVVGPVGSEINLSQVNARATDIQNAYYARFLVSQGDFVLSGFHISDSYYGNINIGMNYDKPFTRLHLSMDDMPFQDLQKLNIVGTAGTEISRSYDTFRISAQGGSNFVWGQISAAASVSSNIWQYTFTQVIPNVAGTWKVAPGGISAGIGYNTMEVGDTSSGLVSAGWNSADFGTSTMAPIRTGAVVQMYPVSYCDSTNGYVFTATNAVNGTC